MQHHDGRITATRGFSLFYQVWEPDSSCRGLLLLVHGAGEHSGRYGKLAEWFCARGFAVAAVDHCGHGRSPGRPGHVDDFYAYVDDLAVFHQHVAATYPGLPMFLVGHSLGGLIAAHFLLREQAVFDGAILSGALVTVEPAPGLVQRSLVRLLARTLPRLGVLQIDAHAVSRDPAVVAAYSADPLVFHGRMSAGQLSEMFAAMSALQAAAARITLPLLLLHGERDELAAPRGSRLLKDSVGSVDSTLRIYPELKHEIFNEPEREQVLEDVRIWCEARLQHA